MPRSPLNEVLHQLHAAGERDGAGSTDGELLTRFLSQRDHDALAIIVQRHAPMVWGVCRRVLRNPHDAEDAFQATFLVLVRKATTVIPREMVANWLYGVAHQTAVRQRATAAKRGGREMQLKEMPEPAAAEARMSDLLPLLDQELSRLPEHHRVLIVLCELEGKTRKEAARQLGCPEGTVASRLSRARDMLAKRMARHGLAVSGGLLAAAFSQSVASAGVPNSVVSSTIHVATLLAANKAVGVISGPVAALTEGVLKTMLLKKIMTTTMVVLALSVAVITGGSLALGQTEGTGKPSDKPPVAAEKPIDKPPATAVAAKDAVVNTPTILGKLQGEWELQPKTEGEYKQRMLFTASSSGNWQRSKETLPMSITYYVEGRELLIQYYHEPNGAFNYRLKQLRFEYKLDKDILTLTAGDAAQTWKRIPKANPKPEGVKLPPEKEPFTAWGQEVGGLQAGLGFKAGEKRVYTHGETINLVVRVRNVSKETVKFEYVRQYLDQNPPVVTDREGKIVSQPGTTVFGIHNPVPVSLEPGTEIELESRMAIAKKHGASELYFELLPVNGKTDPNAKESPLFVGLGKISLHYDQVIGTTHGHWKHDPALSKLATGKLELEVKEPEKLSEKEAFTAWGKEVGGLQAGLGFKAGEKRIYRHGETVTLVVRVRNVIKNPLAASTLTVTDKYIPGFYFDWPPTVADGNGKAVALIRVASRGGDYNTKNLTVEFGKEVELAEVKLELRPESESGDKGSNVLYGTGKFQVHYERLMYGSGKWAISSILSNLATGKLELEVKEAPAEKPKVLTPEQAVKIAGDSELTKKFNATKPAVEFKVEFVTKAIQVKASGEKDAAWVHGHSPNDVCLGTLVVVDDQQRTTRFVAIQRFVAILTEKAIKQFNKAGITDLEKHFKGKTVRVTGPITRQDSITRQDYRGEGSIPEVEIVIDDQSQIDVVDTTVVVPEGGKSLLGGTEKAKPPVKQEVETPEGGKSLLGGTVPKAKPPVKQEVETPEGGKSLLGGTVPKAKPPVKQEVLTPEEAIKIASDSKLTKEFNENKPAVEFKVQFVTKAVLVKASGEKDAGWVHGHSPDDICLGALDPQSPLLLGLPGSENLTRTVATLTGKAVKQFNKAGINDLQKHFHGKTIRVRGTLSMHEYDSSAFTPAEVVILIDDLSQLEVVK